MEKIGLFYGKSARKTSMVAEILAEKIGKDKVDLIPVETASKEDLNPYKYLIMGGATWFDGELPSYWDEILPDVETLSMKGKKVAIYGLGDQASYPENFVDSIGLLANLVKHCGGEIVGYTSTEGYEYERSQAEEEGKFMGLALDFENQEALNEKRISDWVAQILKEFGI